MASTIIKNHAICVFDLCKRIYTLKFIAIEYEIKNNNLFI